MNEQDMRAVEGMARCGISLDGLIGAFPNFPAEEIKKIYKQIHKEELDAVDTVMKMNCS